MERLICIAIGYLFGVIQTGYFYGKIKHTDIREHGSGNAGSTNALRTFGVKAGVIVLLGDTLKVIIATLIVRFIYTASHPDDIGMLVIYTGFGAVLGHNFPFYLKFKGGKGIAATAGMVIATLSWQTILIAAIIFVLVFLITRYVSAGSLVVVLAVFTLYTVFGMLGKLPGYGEGAWNSILEASGILFLNAILAYIRHAKNIGRLLNGTEKALKFTRKGEYNG